MSKSDNLELFMRVHNAYMCNKTFNLFYKCVGVRIYFVNIFYFSSDLNEQKSRDS